MRLCRWCHRSWICCKTCWGDRVRRLLWIFLTLALLAAPVSAVDAAKSQADMFGLDELERAVPEGAQAYLEDVSPTEETDFSQAVGEILEGALRESGPIWKKAGQLMLTVLLVVVLCQMVHSFADGRATQATALAGALAITACCASEFSALMGLARETLDEISSFSSLLMPVMAAATAASGGSVSAGGLYSVTAIFSNVLIRLSQALFLPLVYGILALAMVDSALEQDRLKGMRQFLEWVVRGGLKAVMYLYTGFMALTGILSGSADAATLKAARFTLSGMIPVVGGIISDAAETVLSSAGLLKSTIGTFGMLAVVGAFVVPFLRIGITYLAFKLAAALSVVLGGGQGQLLEGLGSAMGFLLAMIGSAALMCLFACCCFLKVVQP